MRTTLSTLIAGIGLALSAWLAILKAAALPCFDGGCAPVIQSSYGSLFGLPVGLYAAALWLVVFLARSSRLRMACCAALALGSVVFVALQVFVLKAFCPYCMVHAGAAWVSLMACRTPPWRWGAAAALACAAAVLAVNVNAAGHPRPAGRPALAALAREQKDGLYWLGPRGPGSPVLVLSLTCPACLDKLAALTQFDFSHSPNGPALYFKAGAGERDLTVAFIAAVLARPGDRREAFLSMAAFFLSQKDPMLADPAGAAKLLRAMLPDAASREAEAAELLARQTRQLEAASIVATPLLIRADGTSTAFFKIEDIFR